MIEMLIADKYIQFQISDLILVDPFFEGLIISISISKEHICSYHI